MLKIAEVVEEILTESDLATEALRQGVLNLSAYADQIHSEVERRTWKAVRRPTIVVALSRIAQRINQVAHLVPSVHLDQLSIKSPVCDVTYERTRENSEFARSLVLQLERNENHFLTVTEGVNEITVLASEDQYQRILDHFPPQPVAQYRDLVAITVTFSNNYIPEPNVIYAILTRLAAKRVNLIEIVSTYTALTMVIERKEMETAVNQLNTLFKDKAI